MRVCFETSGYRLDNDMRILLHTMATPNLGPIGAIDLARELELDGIDLILQSNYRCSLDPAASSADVQAIADAAADRRTPIRALTPYYKSINDPDERIRGDAIAGFRRAIEHAAALGAENVRVLAGSEVLESQWEPALEILVDSLHSLAAFASRFGVSLNIENHDGTMADDATRTAKIWRAVDRPNVGIIYDPANLTRDGKEEFPRSLAIQAEGIRHVHVKDYVFSPDFPNGRCAVVLGEGEIPWRRILRQLYERGYRGDLSLEYETRWVPEQLPDPAVGLARSRDFLHDCLAMASRA
jgi:L-ribulose-5-phosphate 3-epimerase